METITRKEAVIAAINSIEEFDLPHPCTLQRCLENVDLAHCLLIHRLDDPGASYYILYWLLTRYSSPANYLGRSTWVQLFLETK